MFGSARVPRFPSIPRGSRKGASGKAANYLSQLLELRLDPQGASASRLSTAPTGTANSRPHAFSAVVHGRLVAYSV